METLTALGIATAVATILAPFLTQVTKNKLGVDSLWAYGIHIAVSIALSIGALYATGELKFDNFAGTFTAVAFGAQTLFQLFKKFSGLRVSPPKEEETPPIE